MHSKRLSLPLLLGLATLMLSGCSDEERHTALGTLERDRITLSATASEIITAQPVAEGTQVEQGRLLVQLDTTLQALAVEMTQAEIAQQEAYLEQLRNGPRPEEIDAARARVESAEAALEESERDIVRTRSLVDRGLAARADLDHAQARVDGNAARVRDAGAQLRLLLSGTREEEIRRAEAQLQASRIRLDVEQKKLRDLSIVATRAGIIDSLPFNTGERVAAGQQLVVLLSDDPPYARIFIPEPVRTDLSIGDSLQVSVDGMEQPYTGTVRWIALEPAFTPYYALNRTERSRLVYLAEVQLDEAAASLPAGMPVQVELP